MGATQGRDEPMDPESTTQLGKEAAEALRAAAAIADPYIRADAIWEALERIDAAAGRLGGRPAARCGEVARRLEGSCEANRESPGRVELERCARALDRISPSSSAVQPGREPDRACSGR